MFWSSWIRSYRRHGFQAPFIHHCYMWFLWICLMSHNVTHFIIEKLSLVKMVFFWNSASHFYDSSLCTNYRRHKYFAINASNPGSNWPCKQRDKLKLTGFGINVKSKTDPKSQFYNRGVNDSRKYCHRSVKIPTWNL